ncbi:hypothetical protein [Micromonospora echinaurantiaca]|uniref:hypothetical protein n=1 Tax=Micromonospora echinaurantiaca TaxID=47857 RepID=UPI000B5ADCD3|nr:hypothetical protein [Micromonospora echinaurantiaca]
MTSIWRDFCKALVAAVRRPDEAALRAERGRAVRRLAEEKVREQERRLAGPDRPRQPAEDVRPTAPASGGPHTGPASGGHRSGQADDGRPSGPTDGGRRPAAADEG